MTLSATVSLFLIQQITQSNHICRSVTNTLVPSSVRTEFDYDVMNTHAVI